MIFARIEAKADAESAESRQRAFRTIPRPADDDLLIGRTELKLLVGGLIVAVIANLIPLTRALLSPLVTLLHEFGHAVAAWLLGCPAVPAFDFVYGGGITHYQGMQLPIVLLIAGGWIWLGWLFRGNPRTLVVLAGCSGVWLVAVSSGWRREVVIASMGHGGEFILAGVFLYMALANVGWRNPDIERPVGAFVAFFVQIHSMQFAWRLRHDAGFLDWYRGGKGGALMNDLEVIALDLRIRTGMPLEIVDVAGWLLTLSLMPIAVAIGLYLCRARIRDFGTSLLYKSLH